MQLKLWYNYDQTYYGVVGVSWSLVYTSRAFCTGRKINHKHCRYLCVCVCFARLVVFALQFADVVISRASKFCANCIQFLWRGHASRVAHADRVIIAGRINVHESSVRVRFIITRECVLCWCVCVIIQTFVYQLVISYR